MSRLRLSRRDLLAGASAALAGGALLRPGAARATGRPRRLMVILADGGWDVTFSMDGKLGNPAIHGPEIDIVPNIATDTEETRWFGDSAIVCNDRKRPAVTRFFDVWGARTAVVNGVWSESIVHQDGRARMLTGTKFITNADVATIAGRVHGADLPLGTVDFAGRGFAGPLAASAGRVGASSQLRTLVDPTAAFPAPEGAGYTLPTWWPSEQETDLVTSHLRARTAAFRAPGMGGPVNDAAVADLVESYDRRDRLVRDGASILSGLVPGYWPDLELQAALAVEFLAKGLCQTVTLGLDAWDTHETNSVQHRLYERLFATLETIATGLVANGLLEDTLVVVLSEMGRTPQINAQLGKDHWPHTSMLLFGGGIRGGRTYGATDDGLESLPADFDSGEATDLGKLIKYDNLAAGILLGLDVDPGEWLPGVEAFRAPFV